MATLDMDTLEFEFSLKELDALEEFLAQAKANVPVYATWATAFPVTTKSDKYPETKRSLILRVS